MQAISLLFDKTLAPIDEKSCTDAQYNVTTPHNDGKSTSSVEHDRGLGPPQSVENITDGRMVKFVIIF
jgi:hypothetical protein